MLKAGKHVLNMAPSKENPRNSEGAFLTLKDGRILFIYSRFTGEDGRDDAHSEIAAIYSHDNGETWSHEPKVLFVTEQFAAKNIMSVSLMRMQNDDVGLFFLIRHLAQNMRLYLFRSTDEGDTFGEGISCISAQGAHVVNNDRVLRTKTGRIIVPYNSDHLAFFSISDDDGYTFRRAKQECANPFPCAVAGLQETDIVELSGGIIWALMRNDLGFQMEAFSMDGGDSWTPPQPSVFTSPPSPISIKRLQKNNALFVVWNPVPNYNTRSRPPYLQGRTPLVCAISLDDGKTWAEPMLLEDDQDRGFCYPAIHELNDGVLISYCGGNVADGGCLCRQIINKVRFDEMDFTVQKTSALYRLPY